jgi:drug/metabolite transporter (DMT)-like permease
VLLLIGVVTTAIGWLLWVYVLDNMTAGAASLGTLAAPVVAMASSSYHFGERPGLIESLGMGLIITALLVLSWNGARRTQFAPAPEIHTP